MIAAVSGCTTPTEPLESGVKSAKGTEVSAATAIPAEGETAAAAAKTETANVLKQKNTVAQKGTYIRVLVNGKPITNYDIQRRAKFRQLRRLSASQDDTINELIDERVKMTAAAERNMVATDEQVNDAFANFAKSNKATPEKMAAQLDGIGIGADHFKEYIRAQITWSRLAGGRLQSETRQKTASTAIVDLRKSGQQKPKPQNTCCSRSFSSFPRTRPPPWPSPAPRRRSYTGSNTRVAPRRWSLRSPSRMSR